MDIATLIGVSGQVVSPNQTNIAISDKNTTNVFGQLLREFVMQGNHTAEQDTKLSSDTNQSMQMASLLAIFGHSQVALDLSKETSLSVQEQGSISLTEVLAALQSLISKDAVSLNVESIDEITPSKPEEEIPESINDIEDEIDPAILDLAGSLSIQVQPNLLTSSPDKGINVSGSITSSDMVSVSEAEVTLSSPNARGQATSDFERLGVPETLVSGKETPQILSSNASVKGNIIGSTETDSIDRAILAKESSTSVMLNSDELPTKAAGDLSSHSTVAITTGQIKDKGELSALAEAKTQTEFTVPVQPAAEMTTPTITSSISDTVFVRAKADLPNISALHQIVDSVRLLTQQNKTEVRLHLKPESLGQILVQLDFADNHVSVRMLAETSQTQKVIQDHFSQLKEAFAAQGLQINGLSVNVGSDGSTFDLPNRQSNDQTHQSSQGPINSLPDETSQSVTTGSTVNGWFSSHSVDYHA